MAIRQANCRHCETDFEYEGGRGRTRVSCDACKESPAVDQYAAERAHELAAEREISVNERVDRLMIAMAAAHARDAERQREFERARAEKSGVRV